MGKIENGLLDNIDPEMDLEFYGVDLNNEKAFNLFIKKCEFLCRKSLEYEMWAKRTKALAVNQNEDPEKNDAELCPICGISYEYAQAESHHHPVTLFNLCVRQFQEWVDDQILTERRPLDLIQEVMEKHLCNEVEYVVLCKHCHEKYHNGEHNITAELQKIINYKRTLKTENYPNSVKEIIDAKRKLNETNWEKRKFEQKVTFGDLHDSISTEDILGSIFHQLNENEYLENLKKDKVKYEY